LRHRTPPCAWARTGRTGEDAREIALIPEPADDRDISQRQGRGQEKALGLPHAKFRQVLVWAHSRRAAEGLGEVTRREAASAGHVGDRETCGKAGMHDLLGATLLSWCEGASNSGGRRMHAARVRCPEPPMILGRDLTDDLNDHLKVLLETMAEQTGSSFCLDAYHSNVFR
jgi:hypothetical protein